MIPVTKPFLPDKKEYDRMVGGIWDRHWLTNDGPMLRDLEIRLGQHLGVTSLSFVSNGTIALQIAIKALGLKGEIITTPFTYVATTSSIVWENCKPVYVDIDSDTLNIDAAKIEAAITPDTSAIIATHVYGNPCNVEAIKIIADKYNLKVIYDAAHAFGVRVNGKSIFSYGDISTCSTHATKLFHTVEGGFIVSNDRFTQGRVNEMRNFGHKGPETFEGIGINGKNSEFHAAMGLVNLNHIEAINEKRKQITERYNSNLKEFDCTRPIWHKDSENNYAYYPVIFSDEKRLLKCTEMLNANEIFGRRYFYPSLPLCLPYVENISLKNVDDISRRIYCLPLYHTLTFEEVDKICSLLLKNG